jgi:hypothetical protein
MGLADGERQRQESREREHSNNDLVMHFYAPVKNSNT